ncbi:hypothetical protein MLD38_024126 [Melastoma candidum]|uniref:Uncharacterized protein n=1 Tax=Melastoma candidum TaxID=119954 RepID=A0ACB9NY29_9MYRT|nr:hypothetical protein MLD38_024126 [Melastoma candidum]
MIVIEQGAAILCSPVVLIKGFVRKEGIRDFWEGPCLFSCRRFRGVQSKRTSLLSLDRMGSWSWSFLVMGRPPMAWFLMLLAVQLLATCRCLNDEGLALLGLRERIASDPFGALRDWTSKDGEFDHCSWFGVECSDGKVVVLNLGNLCLGGTLAPEIGKLTYIKSITLRNNTFSGAIPEEISNLKELEFLDLGLNNFSGAFPSKIGNNLSMTILLLDNNDLLAPLSPEINQLKLFSESLVDDRIFSLPSKGSPRCAISWACKFVRMEDSIPTRVLVAASGSVVSSPYARESHPPPEKSPNPMEPPPPPPPAPEVSGVPPPESLPRQESNERKTIWSKHPGMMGGIIGGSAFVLITFLGVFFCKGAKVATVKPWATGLSGQLQKAFVTGVPKLKRAELETACEDFSNVVGSSSIGTIYKGTLSSGVEIAVASVPVKSAKDWSKDLESQFRSMVETLSKVNHKNFANLIGYCEEEEPFTRMMVFEYAPNGTLFEHLHIKESEHLDWKMRLRVAMGVAYCLEQMHKLNPPIAHKNLNSSAVNLTDDYAAKISDYNCWTQVAAAEMQNPGFCLVTASSTLRGPEANVYAFGVILFEMITGRLPYSVDDNGSVDDWASDYLRGERPLKEMVDPTLESFNEQQAEGIGQLIWMCVDPDPRRRPPMAEVTARLRAMTSITPDAAIPKISPLWWAELEIVSTEAN